MSKQFNVAVVGATGAVGETILNILEERNFPIANLYPLASSRSAGSDIEFKGANYSIEDLDKFDFTKVDIALFSAGGDISAKYAPIATHKGAIVIDNTSFYRYDNDIPLVIPEVNPHAIAGYKNKGIIANPNCSTIQMLVALKPIYDLAGIDEITVSTYQAVSGSGRKAIDELIKHTGSMLNGRQEEPEVYSQSIAFNVLPQIDVFMENGYTKEEMKMVWETHKILEDNTITVNPTAVRVPVLYGHSEAINLKLKSPCTSDNVRKLLRKSAGIEVIDNPSELQFPTPLKHAAGMDHIYVGRIRQELNNDKGLNLWVVGDNVRKGAALNAVQIAEILIADYL